MQSKLHKYNQILLAIGGTATVLFIIIGGIIVLSQIWPSSYEEQGLIPDSEVQRLSESGVRKEIISIYDVQVLDSVKQLMLFPVTQSRLDHKESLNNSLGLMNTFSGKDGYYGGRLFNNLLVYSAIENETKILFSEKVGISSYGVQEVSSKRFLVMSGATDDSNSNGILNDQDCQKLFIYDIERESMHSIETPDHVSIEHVYKPRKFEGLVARVLVDRQKDGNKDNDFNSYFNVDLELMKLDTFINNTDLEKVQSILQGTN